MTVQVMTQDSHNAIRNKWANFETGTVSGWLALVAWILCQMTF